MPSSPLHVLIVARWYPSHDQPGRGTFVADLAAALGETGRAEVTVASFEPTHVRGVTDSRADRAGQANGLVEAAVVDAMAVNRPRAWGVPDLPVARLPVILDGDRRRAGDIVDAHAGPLMAFARALNDRQPIDVIHAHTGIPDGIAALRVADELDLPLLVTEHASTTADELVDDEARRLYQRLVAPPRRVVAVSRALAHDVARALGVAETAITVLPNAVPVDGFPLGPAGDRRSGELLYVGSRKASKGIETLLRAFADVHARRPAIQLRLIGSPGLPADDARWQALVAELGIGDATFFEPAAPRDVVAAAMRRAAVFVHPSPHETFGMVAAEALASGLPMAATPSGGVDEIVGRDGRFGAIATSTAVPALADAIDRMLAAGQRVDRQAMRAHIEANYAAPAVAQRAIEMYESVIVTTKRQPRASTAASRAGLPVAAGDRDDVGTRAAATGRGQARTRGPFSDGFRLPLVIALARGQAIERIALLPPPLRDRLTIVTSLRGRYADDRDLPLWSDWLELDQERFYRDAVAGLEASAKPAGGLGRLKSAFGGPNVDKLRKDLLARRDDVRHDGTQQFLERAAERIPDVGSAASREATLWIVALDADDMLLADRLGRSIGPVAPGGLRWLADAWDAAGRPI